MNYHYFYKGSDRGTDPYVQVLRGKNLILVVGPIVDRRTYILESTIYSSLDFGFDTVSKLHL